MDQLWQSALDQPWGKPLPGRTPADRRGIIFQSLAATRDGRHLPFDPEDCQKQAERRAFNELEECHRENAETNCDDAGDKMYHDVVDVLFRRSRLFWRP